MKYRAGVRLSLILPAEPLGFSIKSELTTNYEANSHFEQLFLEMRDFHFWMSLPFILQGGLSELRSESSKLSQELEELEQRIKETRTHLEMLVCHSKGINPGTEESQKVGSEVARILGEMDLKKNRIITFSINMTLRNLKELIERFERDEKVSAEGLRTGLKLCRSIVQKSIEEFGSCPNEKERSLYLMLKVYAEKCLEKFVSKINSLLQEIDSESDGSIEEEENDDKFETSTTYSSDTNVLEPKNRSLIGNVHNFSLDSLF